MCSWGRPGLLAEVAPPLRRLCSEKRVGSIPKACSMEATVVVSMGTVTVTTREPGKKVRRGWSREVEWDVERRCWKAATGSAGCQCTSNMGKTGAVLIVW